MSPKQAAKPIERNSNARLPPRSNIPPSKVKLPPSNKDRNIGQKESAEHNRFTNADLIELNDSQAHFEVMKP